MGQYGSYSRKVVDSSNDDHGMATAIALEAAKGAILTKTAREPMTVDRFGFAPTVQFDYDTLVTKGVLGLYKYPQGLICVDLPSAIAMCNSLLTAMNAHAADATMHTTHADATNFPVNTAPVTDLATLLVKVNLLQIAYAAHNVDAALASGWAFHIAQVTHALANATAVTTLATAIAKLNDMLVKYNLHDLSSVCHALGNLHPAYKVLLATINKEDGDLVAFEYVVDVDNKVTKAVSPATGVAPKGIADLEPGDQVAIEIKVQANGGTEVGDYQPFFCWHVRAEAEGVLPYLVNRTPVKTPVDDALA